MRRALFALTAASALLVLPACEHNAATGRKQFILMSWDQEIALGAEAMSSLTSEYGGRVSDAGLSGYVDMLGQHLASFTTNQVPAEMPWEFTLLDSDVVNAFALPGGKVFFSRGLAEQLTDEAQMALVLGHEIGHVTARHGAERISHALAVQGIVFGAAVAAGASEDDSWMVQALPLVVGLAGQGYLLKFNRDQESEADELGLRYMVQAGYDPAAIFDVMTVLAGASQGGQPPEFLSTHPHPDTRIEQGRRLIANEYAYTQNNPQYMRQKYRYQRDFLDRAALLPPPPDRQSRINIRDASSWCWHCAHGEE